MDKNYFQKGYNQLINLYSQLQVGNDPLTEPINVEVSTDITEIKDQKEYIFGTLGGMMLSEEEKVITNKLKESAQEIRLNSKDLKRSVQGNDSSSECFLLCSEDLKKYLFKKGHTSEFYGREILWTHWLKKEILLINPKEFMVNKTEVDFLFNPKLASRRELEIKFLQEPTIKMIKIAGL